MIGASPVVPQSRFVAAMAEFWAGFVTPTRSAFALMMGSFLAIAILIFICVTPSRLAGPLGDYLSRSTRDTEGFATHEALKLALNPPTDVSRLYIVSDSLLAHAFASDSLMASALQSRTGKKWQAAFLTTPLQGPLDEAALAEYATSQKRGVVILSLDFSRFGERPDEIIALYRMGRLGIRSDWADEEVASLGKAPRVRTGVYAIDNSSFLLRNAGPMAGRLLMHRPASRRIDAYLLHEPLDSRALAEQRAVVLESLYRAAGPDGAGIQLLSHTVKLLQARGNLVLFAEAPVSATLFESAQDQMRYAAYLRKAAAFAHALGAGYCRLADGYQPAPASFPDYIHVDDTRAQAKLRDVLAGCVAMALQGSEKP